MDNDIQNIFKEQAKVLPLKVREFIVSGKWESDTDNIIEHFKLPPENANSLRTDTMLVLVGLIHPDEFRGEIKERLGVDETIIDSIATEIEEKIFAPIRVDLVEFFEEQEVREEELEKEGAEQSSGQIPAKTWEKMPDIAPDNLPIGEGEVNSQQLIVNREQSTVNNGETHPFEEKMKKVFTGASTTIGDLAIETPATEGNISISSDPYREPFE